MPIDSSRAPTPTSDKDTNPLSMSSEVRQGADSDAPRGNKPQSGNTVSGVADALNSTEQLSACMIPTFIMEHGNPEMPARFFFTKDGSRGHLDVKTEADTERSAKISLEVFEQHLRESNARSSRARYENHCPNAAEWSDFTQKCFEAREPGQEPDATKRYNVWYAKLDYNYQSEREKASRPSGEDLTIEEVGRFAGENAHFDSETGHANNSVFISHDPGQGKPRQQLELNPYRLDQETLQTLSQHTANFQWIQEHPQEYAANKKFLGLQ